MNLIFKYVIVLVLPWAHMFFIFKTLNKEAKEFGDFTNECSIAKAGALEIYKADNDDFTSTIKYLESFCSLQYIEKIPEPWYEDLEIIRKKTRVLKRNYINIRPLIEKDGYTRNLLLDLSSTLPDIIGGAYDLLNHQSNSATFSSGLKNLHSKISERINPLSSERVQNFFDSYEESFDSCRKFSKNRNDESWFDYSFYFYKGTIITFVTTLILFPCYYLILKKDKVVNQKRTS